ncbi:MAG TPA: ATP-binding protein [Vicinamibacterales bacterium]|nr:ATP-binding protein [Vicinamibacterales bacterium]
MSEVDDLRERLAEAEELLRAIRHGEVDALLVSEGTGERVYTLRGADAPYRALVEQMQEGAVTVTKTGDIVYSNSRFAALLGAPLQRVIGASIDEFVDTPDQPVLRSLITAGAGSLRTRLRTRGRVPLETHISVSSVTIDGTHHRTLIVTDMSTLTRVQRESRSKDEFLAMLAHELRNPLGAIGGAVQVLALAPLQDSRANQARDIIERQTMHMARLVDDLLDVGRVVTGKIALDLKPMDLAEFVRSYVAAMMSGNQTGNKVVITADSVWVRADIVRMEQIVGNLVSNALKFAPPDRPVRVSVRGDGEDAILQVADEGAGIEPDLLPQVFDLFVQGPATVDRAQGGLGIGLTLVHRLVDLHGGTIDAFSAGANQGSTFTVRLPATEPVATDAHPIQPTPGRRMRVLLVDDNADSREMYAMLLQADGHDVHEAEDGPAALAAFQQRVPDVAVIDIGLPGIDGYELARRIRSGPSGRAVALIALTGYGFPEDRERSRLAGFDRHLVKPASPEDLRQELMNVGQVPRPAPST